MRTPLPLLLAAALAGCSFIFDGTAPELPLLGSPPAHSSFERLNRNPAEDEDYVLGRDGATWLSITEKAGPSSNVLHNLRVSRPTVANPPPGEETIPIQGRLYTTYRAFFFVAHDPEGKEPTRITVRAAGEPAPGRVLALPPSRTPPALFVGGADDRFVYWVPEPATKTFLVVFLDGLPPVEIQIPAGVNPARPSLFWNRDSRKIVLRAAQDRLLVLPVSHDAPAVDLGARPGLFALGTRPARLDPEGREREALLSLGTDGVRWVPFDGSKESVIEPAPCRKEVFTFSRGRTYYLVEDELRAVPFDGSTPPEVVKKGGLERLYGFAPEAAPVPRELFYTRDPGTRYIDGVGDGWLGDWNFMERGRQPQFSRDAKRLRWIEHSANTGRSGDLLVASIPRGEPQKLARNVARYEELADGRILALAHRAFVGVHNRLIVIDEQERAARWLIEGVWTYFHLPGSTDIVVDVFSGPETHDLLRVPIPPRTYQLPDGDGGADLTR